MSPPIPRSPILLHPLRLAIQHDQRALQHIDTLINLILGHDQTRHEPNRRLPTAQQQDPALPNELEYALSILIPHERET